MGRCSSVVGALIALVSLSFFIGCSSTSSSNTPNPPNVPAAIVITPASTVSVDIGAVTTFSVAVRNGEGNPITGLAISFVSSNPEVLTISNGGAACAGQWDSLSSPVVCTPGPAGTAVVTASASGVTSPPTTVYVHQHIDHIEITEIGAPPHSCFTQGETWNYEATVFARVGSGLVDITPTVGPLNWGTLNFSVAKLNPTASGLLDNQIQLAAAAPGTTQFFATNTGVNSNSLQFKSCLVKSIDLFVLSDRTTSVSLSSGTSKVIQAKVIDELGNELTKPPLTWSSSNTAAVTVPTGAPENNTGSITAVAAGGANVIASCTPPSCNAGIFPSRPIYPEHVISVAVTAKTAATPSAWVTTTQCDTGENGPFFNCGTIFTQVTGANNTIGSSIFLPNPPNSLVFGPGGARAFLGSRKGLMIVDPSASSGSTANTVPGVTGKVLAVSADGNRVITSDTDHATDPNGPDKVFIYNQATAASPVVLLIPDATAAAFSPDGLKAFIVSGTKLYAFSTVDAAKPPQTLPGIGRDVTFSQYGAFAYVTTAPNRVTPVVTCTNQVLTASSVTTPGTIQSLRPLVDIDPNILPDGRAETHLIGLDPPSIDIITQRTAPVDCPPSVELLDVQSFNLGEGDFTPIAMLLSGDTTKAYVVAQNLSAVLVFDVASKTTSAIPLAGNVKPLGASVTNDGSRIYVTTKCENFAGPTQPVPGKCLDPTLHVIDAVLGNDIQQITFDNSFCTNVDNTTIFCTPDLVAVKP